MTFRFCDETDLGFSWIVEEPVTRTAHALVHKGRVWFVDPVDWPEAIERAAHLGEPAAVLQLIDRHNRDCAAVAERLNVPHLLVPQVVPESPFDVVGIRRSRRWQEVALWWPGERTLAVAEAIGTNTFYTGGKGRAGVHVLLRLTPPRKLAAYGPEHLLVGHGEGVHGPAATAALREALRRSRRDLPRVLWKLPSVMRGG